MNNKVIIIGNDHVNTLGIIRTFGEQGINPYVFVISKTGKASIKKSKYICKCWICKNEEVAIQLMITVFQNEINKPVVIPTSDLATYKIDENYDILSKKFIVPNINQQAGNIIKYMDKLNQYNLVTRNETKMARSEVVDLKSFKCKMDFPCILKPLISANGQKDDITICKNIQEYRQAVEKLRELKYTKVLVQKFIDYKYEIGLGGFSYNGKTSIAGVIKKERIWPQKKGSTTFGIVIPKEKYHEIVDKIEKLINSINYNGIFYAECFVCKDDFYINEINFRNGAPTYAYGEARIAYYWYLSNIYKKFYNCPLITDEYYFMDDQADLHNVIDKEISYSTYRKDKKKCKILLEKNKLDNHVARSMKISKILNKIQRLIKR